MKIGIKQGIIIGAAVLAFGGFVVHGALAAPNPRPVPMPVRTVRAQTMASSPQNQIATPPVANSQNAQNFVNGMINWMQGYFNQEAANGQVTPQEQQGLNQMYNFMRQHSRVMYNMMGGYGGGMMGGFYNGNQSTRSSL